MFAHVFVPGPPVSAAWPIDQHQRHQLAFAGLHQRQRLVTLIHRAETAWKQRDGIRMSNEDQLAGEEIFERDQLFVLAYDRVGALFPGQADISAETILRPGAFVAGLHDATPGARDDHEPRLSNLSAELDPLLILHARRLGSS